MTSKNTSPELSNMIEPGRTGSAEEMSRLIDQCACRPAERRYGQMMAIARNQEGHDRTCDYWYLVHTCGRSHIAFNKRENFLAWVKGVGLSLSGELPPHGTYGVVHIVGEYKTAMHLSYDEFYAHADTGVIGRTLSNGRYTMSITTRDEDGLRTVHTLNSNRRFRPEYDYQESRALVG
ncbi:hypothetical protein [Paraburkholderia sp. J8-2]|uniref:hypothetical protein n=1 Tax=Paraburkholderia sp. J8-2 TaxID=2805440 RepID=UPI002AB7DDC3|nr:hypothetical protein [Paraburkholderia sp. J8-2]